MYRLLHWLFGWDYIVWRNDWHSGISRVQIDGMGRVWYWRYRSTALADTITDPSTVMWLTCEPRKYFPYTAAWHTIDVSPKVARGDA